MGQGFIEGFEFRSFGASHVSPLLPLLPIIGIYVIISSKREDIGILGRFLKSRGEKRREEERRGEEWREKSRING